MTTSFAKADIEDLYELSPMQLGILFESLKSGRADPYRQQFIWTLEGDVNPSYVAEAWAGIVARHSILRSGFHWSGLSKPAQTVIRASACPAPAWRDLDWRDLPADERQARLAEFARAERDAVADFARPPLMRVALLRLEDRRWALIWSIHHIIVDGWSGALLLGEFLELYRALEQSRPAALAPAPAYKAYISALRERNTEDARSYWAKSLAGLEAPTAPLLSEPGAPLRGGGMRSLSRGFDERLRDAVIARARALKATPNSLCQAALALTLGRYARSDDVVLGVIQADRPEALEGAAGIVGPMISCLPFRIALSRDMTRGDLVAATQLWIGKSFAHNGLSLPELHALADLPEAAPLFSVLYAFESFSTQRAEERAQSASFRIVDGRIEDGTNYPLSLVIHPGAAWSLRVLYAGDRYDAQTIERFADHYLTALRQLCGEPGARLGETPLADGEATDLRGLWQGPAAASPRAEAPALFADHWRAQVTARADRPCFVDPPGSLTYAEADRDARKIAAFLMALEGCRHKRVGICGAQDSEALVSIIGATLAGWAWIPLVTDLPRSRLLEMAEDAELDLVLTDRASRDIWSETGHRCHAVSELRKGAERAVRLPQPDAEDTAYILFTSGSTGKPKAVEIPHRAWAQLFSSVERHIAPEANARVLQHASFAFDAFLLELTVALTSGGPLVCTPEDRRAPGGGLEDYILEQDVACAFLSPSILARITPAEVPGLKLLLTGGEACPPDLPSRWLRDHPGGRLFNLYGPTETTVFVSSAGFSEPRPCHDIGHPNLDTRIYLLDHHGCFAPAGLPGEIVVAGRAVGKGYLNRPELTGKAFPQAAAVLPGGHLEPPGARVYRTGDCARFTPDGRLRFLGRGDGQVKINGVRIELEEVAAVLRRHPIAADVAVLLHDKQLAAFAAVPAPRDRSDAEGALRAHAARHLPGHLQPKWIEIVGEIPLRLSGKADKAALLARLTGGGVEKVPAQGIEETEMLALWQSALPGQDFGVTDNFFSLGGNSIDAMRLAALAQKCSLRFDVPTLMRHPTVRSLVASLRTEDGKGAATALPELTREARDVGAITAAQRHDLGFARDPRLAALASGITAFQVDGPLDLDRLTRAWRSCFEGEDGLNAGFTKGPGDVRRFYPRLDPDALGPRLRDVSSAADAERAEFCNAVLLDSLAEPFDLARPPLIRLHCVKLRRDSHVVALTASTALLDAHSRLLLLQRLADHYAGAPARPSPRASALDFSSFLAWREKLKQAGHALTDAAPLDDLLSAGPRPLRLAEGPVAGDGVLRSGRRHLHQLSPESADRLAGISSRAGVSRFVVLLAAFAALARRLTAEEEGLILTPVSHRALPELAGVLGPMTELLPLPLRLAARASPDEEMARIAEDCETFLNRHRLVSLAELAERHAPEALRSPTPFAPTGFTYVEISLRVPRLPGLVAKAWYVPPRHSAFECYFALQRDGAALSLVIYYDRSLFTESKIEEMAQGYEDCLLIGRP